MRIIFKPLFEFITGNVAVMDNLIYNYLILLVVGEIAYQLAWSFVGNLYSIGAIEGRTSGSCIHWSIRLITYVFCAYLIRGFIWVYELVLNVPYWVWWVLIGISAGALVTAIIVANLRKRKINVHGMGDIKEND
ncbi:hypothetical protein [Anaerotignum propionicum]|uniref:MatE n=1 Tax=Anaerotignum propionicum DSM 1682 TaxID=991789 RepID=A0A0X1U7K2_ANAPI|nr:hypothetical protein [Anaerotignum propionicum]AMJ40914.1 hypothetical protein CPRO_13210 [Anaerotignum propionicum DSM 1682]SHE76262.1 hypothetical protein SAMN02745151_01733 [[Clostridium] propionicum DSM 1682] [Anaerotignum propionicum DSM 1682]